jgi:chromosome segregation ATPase
MRPASRCQPGVWQRRAGAAAPHHEGEDTEGGEEQKEEQQEQEQKQRDELEEKRYIDRMWDQYGLTFSTALAARTPIESVEKASKRITELKKEIEQLGDVNIGAIEEFSRVNTRYEYLAGQRDDIEKSRTELKEIIGEITSRMRDIFAEQFKVINHSRHTVPLSIAGKDYELPSKGQLAVENPVTVKKKTNKTSNQ